MAALALLAGCPTQPSPSGGGVAEKPTEPGRSSHFRFVVDDSLQAAGIVYENGRAADQFAIIESLGGGVGVLDYDRDGRDDLFFAGGGTLDEVANLSAMPSRLLRNAASSAEASLDWIEVSEPSGIAAAPMYTHGVTCCDYDNDGFRDVLVTGFGRLQLLQNMGDGSFEDVTKQSGLAVDTLWSSSAAWGDLDRDGHADLYVTHYVTWSPQNNPPCMVRETRDVCSPMQFDGLEDVVYLASGDGTFVRSAQKLPPGKGLAALLFDADGDRDLDVAVANDSTENHLYINQTPNDGSPREVLLVEDGLARGMAYDDEARMNGSMGLAVTDFNDDGRPDVWVSNYEADLLGLYRNDGDGDFLHVSKRMGLGRLGRLNVSWGCVSNDFDADGDEDLAITNGHVLYNLANTAERQQMTMIEAVDDRYERAPVDGYFERPMLGRGLASADFDRDGRVDLAVTNTLDPAAVLLNRTEQTGQSLLIRPVGTVDAREPIGTVVLGTLESGRTVYRQLVGGASYLSTHSPVLHLAWPADDPLRRIEVHWPTGEPTVLDPSSLVPNETTGEVIVVQ